MFMKQEFYDWRASPITQELLKTIAESANEFALKMLNRRESVPLDDQYIKGVIAGLSLASGWSPNLVDEDGNEVPDEA